MKKKLIVLKLFIIFILLATTVLAATDGINISLNKTDINPGDEFIITLSLKDLEKISSGVDSLQGYINIDENVLESITFDSIVKDSNNQVTIGNQKLTVYDVQNLVQDQMPDYGVFFNGKVVGNDCKIVIDLNSKITTTDLLQIKCKVKSNASKGEYVDAIKCEEFQVTSGANSGYNDLMGTVSLNVGAPTPVENKVNNTTNRVVNNTTENNVNRVNNVANRVNNNSSNKVNNVVSNKTNTYQSNSSTNALNTINSAKSANAADATTSKKILPAAGTTADIILKVVFGLSILGLIVYNRYKKYKNV